MILPTNTKGQAMTTTVISKTEVVISEDVTQLDASVEALIVEFNEA